MKQKISSMYRIILWETTFGFLFLDPSFFMDCVEISVYAWLRALLAASLPSYACSAAAAAGSQPACLFACFASSSREIESPREMNLRRSLLPCWV